MELYGYIVLIVVVVGFMAFLPVVSGVGNFNVKKGTKSQGKKREGMVDFKLNEKKDAAKGASSTYSQTDKYSVDSKTGLKKRVIGKFSTDPSSFDFDIDELINEDAAQEKQEQEKRYADLQGKTEEVLDELV